MPWQQQQSWQPLCWRVSLAMEIDHEPQRTDRPSSSPSSGGMAQAPRGKYSRVDGSCEAESLLQRLESESVHPHGAECLLPVSSADARTLLAPTCPAVHHSHASSCSRDLTLHMSGSGGSPGGMSFGPS